MTAWRVGSSVPSSPPSSPAKPQTSAPAPDRPLLWGFSPVSLRSFGLRRHFRSFTPLLASRLCIQTFRPRGRVFDGQIPFGCREFGWGGRGGQKSNVSNPVRNYCGFNPRASNCRLHSGGASRTRSTPMPRGKRLSTAHEVWCEERQRYSC
jgi:hypothetical protein